MVKTKGCILLSWRQPKVPKDSLLLEQLDRVKYSAGGREDWKSTLEQQTFGFLGYVALFCLRCQKANCPKSSYMRTCLFDKQSKLFKIPSFPGKMGVFPSLDSAYLFFPVLQIRGQGRFILAPSSAACHQCESGTALPASHGSWWHCLALPSETPSSHTCLGNLLAAFPRHVFTFFVPGKPYSWFFS